MCLGVYYTVFSPCMVMAIPMQVLVCIGGSSVYTCGECSIVFQSDLCVQEWNKTIHTCVLYCEFKTLSMLLMC